MYVTEDQKIILRKQTEGRAETPTIENLWSLSTNPVLTKTCKSQLQHRPY